MTKDEAMAIAVSNIQNRCGPYHGKAMIASLTAGNEWILDAILEAANKTPAPRWTRSEEGLRIMMGN
jgi:hypothetical protein